jgi:hypothetical protein
MKVPVRVGDVECAHGSYNCVFKLRLRRSGV